MQSSTNTLIPANDLREKVYLQIAEDQRLAGTKYFTEDQRLHYAGRVILGEKFLEMINEAEASECRAQREGSDGTR